MQSNYKTIIDQNLQTLTALDHEDRAGAMGAQMTGSGYQFRAFGAACTISPESIRLDGEPQAGPLGIVISLYALNATSAPLVLEPLKAFKEFPHSMPYVGAFASHTEQILANAVGGIIERRDRIMARMGGSDAPAHVSGDSAMILRPLPKIALCYIFYAADDDFPASVTCLFSGNANDHMPMDGLADVGEYTSRRIVDWVNET